MRLGHILWSCAALVLLLPASVALASGNSSMQDRDFVVSGNLAFFAATPRPGANELWRTDGTESGTVPVADLGAEHHILRMVPTADGVAFFLLEPGYRESLWRSDGTAQGTVKVTDLGKISLERTAIAAQRTMLYFTVEDNREGMRRHVLWRSDLTLAGTIPLVDLPTIADSFAFSGPFLFFTVDTYSYTARQLWRTDGTVAGTIALGKSAGGALAPIGEHGVLFESGGELWRNDGSPGETTRVGSLKVRWLVSAGNLVYLLTDRNGELLRTDGTDAGTRAIFRAADSSRFGEFLPDGENLYFQHKYSWWRYDALTDHVDDLGVPIRDLAVVIGNGLYTAGTDSWGVSIKRPASPQVRLTHVTVERGHQLVVFGSKVLFAGNSEFGVEPWITDGTVQGTHMLRNVFPEARIEGTVIDGDSGSPVEGAEVVLSRDYRGGLLTLKTDAYGRFSGAVEDGDYLLEASSSRGDYARAKWPQRVSARAGSAPEDVRFVLFKGGGIAGRVVDGNGAPVRGMLVYVRGADLYYLVVTDADGTYRTQTDLPRNQEWAVWTSETADYSGVVYPGISCHAGCDPLQQGTRITTRENAVIRNIDFVVRPHGRVRGRLVDALTRLPIRSSATLYVVAQYSKRMDITAGEFEVPLPDGGAKLNVLFPTQDLHKNAYGAEHVVAPAGTTIAADIFVDPTGARITGRVVDRKTGLPEPDVRIAIRDATGQILSTVRTAADGTYATEPQFRPGVYTARAIETGGWLEQEWEGGKPIVVTNALVIRNIDFQLAVRTAITGVIRDSTTGQPLRDVAVQLYKTTGVAVGPTRRTDADGRYVAPVHPRSYTVKAGKYGWKPAAYDTPTAVADVDGAMAEVNLTLAPACITTMQPAVASFGPNGGTGTLTLGAACGQCSFSSSRFIRLPASCATAGEVTYTVLANPRAARTGWIVVPGGALKIEQRGRSSD